MIIRKIEAKGAGKPTAELEFRKGLNVVAGASNTGKSYVVQCIDFILGGTKPPKAIDESKGYEYIEVTFEEDDGRQFSLQRKLGVNAEIVMRESGADEAIVLKGKHKPGFNNLSNRFLRKLGLNDKLLLKSKENLTTQALTVRTLEKIFIIDEARIIADYSPLGTGQNSERTLELSFLSTLLTGIDDTQAKQLRIDADSKTAIQRKMNNLEELIEKLFPGKVFPTLKVEEIDKQLEYLREALIRSDNDLIEAVSLNQSLLDKRTDILRKISAEEQQQQDNLLLIDRFVLLRSKYESDKARLLGIGEAADALDTFTRASCPTCGQELDSGISYDDVVSISASAEAEVCKIDSQLQDLMKAIEEIRQNIDASRNEIALLQEQLTQTNSAISGNIKQKITETNRLKSEIYAKQAEYINVRALIDSRNRALSELGSLKLQAGTSQAEYALNSFDDELEKFVGNVIAILGRWGYPNYKQVEFSQKDRDIVIGGTPRSNFGKGYRAIAFSAFAIGLLTTISKSGRHPGFVVLDSPLTTYKQADKDRGDRDESVAADMKYAFYRDLCDFYKEHQVIVFDNQEPDDDLKSMMKYEHFSQNPNVGRYGFFPVVSVSSV